MGSQRVGHDWATFTWLHSRSEGPKQGTKSGVGVGSCSQPGSWNKKAEWVMPEPAGQAVFDCSHVPGQGPTTVSNTLSEFSFIAPNPRWGKSGREELRKLPAVPSSQRHGWIKPQVSDSMGQSIHSFQIRQAELATPEHLCSLGIITGWGPRQHVKKHGRYFANKGVSSHAYGVFPAVTYGCQCWTIKKAECGRMDAFEL